MRFASEEVRHAFHSLPAETQYEWVQFNETLADSGDMLIVCEVCLAGDPRRAVIAKIVSAGGTPTSDR